MLTRCPEGGAADGDQDGASLFAPPVDGHDTVDEAVQRLLL